MFTERKRGFVHSSDCSVSLSVMLTCVQLANSNTVILYLKMFLYERQCILMYEGGEYELYVYRVEIDIHLCCI